MRISTIAAAGPKGNQGEQGLPGIPAPIVDSSLLQDNSLIARDNLLKGRTPVSPFSESSDITDVFLHRPSIVKGYIKNPIDVVIDREELLEDPITPGNSLILTGTADSKDVCYVFPVYSGDFTSGFQFQQINSVKLDSVATTYTWTYPNTVVFPEAKTADRLEIDGTIGDLCWDTVTAVIKTGTSPTNLEYTFENNTIVLAIDITVNAVIQVEGTLKSGQIIQLLINNFTGYIIELNKHITTVSKVYLPTTVPEELDFAFENGVVTLDDTIEESTTVAFLCKSCGRDFLFTITSFTGSTFITGVRCLYIEQEFSGTSVTVDITDMTVTKQEQGKYLIDGEDFIFYNDRQIFYFLRKVEGYVVAEGSVYYNGINTNIAVRDALLYPQSTYKLDLKIDRLLEVQCGGTLYYHYLADNKSLVLVETPLPADAMIASSELAAGETVSFKFENLPAVGEVTFGDWWETKDNFLVNGVDTEFRLSTSAFSLTVDAPLEDVDLSISGTICDNEFSMQLNSFSGSTLILDKGWASISSVTALGNPVGYTFASNIITFDTAINTPTDITIIGITTDGPDFELILSDFEGATVDLEFFTVTIESIYTIETTPVEIEFTSVHALVFANIDTSSTINAEGTMNWEKVTPAGTVTEEQLEYPTFTGYYIDTPSDWNTIDAVTVDDVAVWKSISLNSFEVSTPMSSSSVLVSGYLPIEGSPAVTFALTGVTGTRLILDSYWTALTSIKVNDVSVGCAKVGTKIMFKKPITVPSTLKLTGKLLDGTDVVYTREKFMGDTLIFPSIDNKPNFVIQHIVVDSVESEFIEKLSTIIINPILTEKSVVVTGTVLSTTDTTETVPVDMSYRKETFTGDYVILPTAMETVNYVYMENVLGKKGNSGYFFCLYDHPVLYFGTNVPLKGAGNVIISGAKVLKSVVTSFSNTWGNMFQLPFYIDEVRKVTIGELVGEEIIYNDDIVVFDYNTQTLAFVKKITGSISYSSDSYNYTGLAAGGETLKIVREIEGVMATTCGTGEHFATLTSEGRNWTAWNKKVLGQDLTVITDYDSIIIYRDSRKDGESYIHNGFTTSELYPMTLKLPLSPFVSDMKRDDRAFINIAFTPDPKFNYLSSTYSALDDTTRVSENSLEPDSIIVLSENESTRGVQGIVTLGKLPVYYGGSIDPYMFMSAYKWFVVEIVATNGNTNVIIGDKYLLCIQNTIYGSRNISCQLALNAPNVAADLFSIEDLLGDEL